MLHQLYAKESEDYIIVTDIPLAKRYKLEPEENFHHKLILGDGYCIANHFVVHFEENLDKVLDNVQN